MNNNETSIAASNEEVENKRDRRKIILLIFLIVLALCLVIGSMLAFFSDYITGNTDITAGTLDITSTGVTVIYQDYAGNDVTTDDAQSNFNPGDVAQISFNVTNNGTKSAWLRGLFTVEFTNLSSDYDTVAKISDDFLIFQGLKTAAECESAGVTGAIGNLTLSNGILSWTDTSPAIINGTVEKESGAMTGSSVDYTVYFRPGAGNDWQNVKAAFDITLQAMQYRNNPSPNWSDVTSTEFSLGS